ncbi:haloacid dehalogenase [Streptomyces sp. CB02923]|uniref:discoidin domain-containing protein n=1 Tax=Streptomyces sp. CB02923 TaxID=1718985 RepID=UPI00093E6D0D|nr:discoidin domain-containing protein [Streptomyces sp. CB02923]OKI04567.1 haloacid dehalogenase [Streptomyces sp. CB02923]
MTHSAKLIAPLLAGALVTTLPPASASASTSASLPAARAAASAAAAADTAPAGPAGPAAPAGSAGSSAAASASCAPQDVERLGKTGKTGKQSKTGEPSKTTAKQAANPDDGDGWTPTATRIDPKDGHHAFVGNGYLGQRIAPNGAGYSAPGETTGWPLKTPRYDGSFVSGLYARGPENLKGRQAIAALPTWTGLDVTAAGDRPQTFDSATPAGRISNYRQTQFIRCGLVRTSLTWTAADGRATDLVYDVLTDRTSAHTGAVRLRMTPHWGGRATVTDRLDGRGARRMTQTGGGARPDCRTMDVTFRTDGTKTDGAVASTLRPGPQVRSQHATTRRAGAAKDLSNQQSVTFSVQAGRSYELTKYVGVDTALTSRTPRAAATDAARRAATRGWDALYRKHAAAWQKLWRSDVEVKGRGQRDLQAWVRAAQYGLLSSTRAGSRNSISPAGLTSDNYAGEIFWDAETWMYPGLLAAHPELAKSIVDYRYRTRAGAAANAEKLGYKGLFYPWTSGSKGDLWNECHSWDPPHCTTQNHLMGDVSLAAWQYYLATKDTAWLRERGWPVMKGIAEFWASRVTRNSDGSYSVKNVAGPDEYSNGVDDGVFTNAGAVTALRNAGRAAALLGRPAPAAWKDIADRIRIPYDAKKGIFKQYDGYENTTIKQADTVLLMYPLEWPMSQRAKVNTLDHYAGLTDPDGPAMTDSVHAVAAAGTGEPGCSTYTYMMRSIRPFVRGAFHQFSEARGDKAGAGDPHAGSPAQDFLTGKGGFLQTFTNGLTGLRMREDRVHLDPMLPPQLSDGVTLRGLRWQGRTYDVEIGAHSTAVRLTAGAPMRVESPEGERVVSRGVPLTLKTRRPDLAATDNAARCTTARATSEEPGMYAGAAVDGNAATSWVPDGPDGTLTVDLGKSSQIGQITPHWKDGEPASYVAQVSTDGKHWYGTGYDGRTPARYVRLTVRGADAAKNGRRPGLAELTVQKAAGPAAGK